MSAPRDAASQAVLDNLLQEHGLSGHTRFFRETLRASLTPTSLPGIFRIAANDRPGESVIDVYGQGYVVQAADMGPGLAFAESSAPNWQETMEMRTLRAGHGADALETSDRVEVEVMLGELLRQGGRLYPVESVTVERAWYCTLPEGFVEVRQLG